MYSPAFSHFRNVFLSNQNGLESVTKFEDDLLSLPVPAAVAKMCSVIRERQNCTSS